MSYTVKHNYLDKHGIVSATTSEQRTTVGYSATGTFSIRFPGKLHINKHAEYTKSSFVVEAPKPNRSPRPGRWQSQTILLPLTLEIRTPDGQLFTATHVTLNDLKRFRDLRGTTQGEWSYTIHCESEPVYIIPNQTRVSGKAHTRIWVEETVTSKSAPPLVSAILNTAEQQRYTFDLYRVGMFQATMKISGSNPFPVGRKMELVDPDGIVVKSSFLGRLNYNVDLRTLNKSRDANGNVRMWSLNFPAVERPSRNPITVWASVIATSTIYTDTLQERINTLIGENGSKLSISGEMKESDLLARLIILDEMSAAAIDMSKILDSVIESVKQDEDVLDEKGNIKEIKKDIAYNLARRSRDIGKAIHVSLNDIKVSTIKINIGASEKILPAIPALKVEVLIEGSITIKLGGTPIGTIKIRDNRMNIEAGMQLNEDGSFSSLTWVKPDMLDVDVHWVTVVATGLASAGLLALGAIHTAEWIETIVNLNISSRFNKLCASAISKVPLILAVMHGDDFTYQSLRLDGDKIVFDYIAPLEPEPKPNKGYRGIIGRSVSQLSSGNWQIIPHNMGDTWKADNLSKIDHIVVVIMENRSFDHVLGYRALLSGHESEEGLTETLKRELEEMGYPIPKLKDSGIEIKTKFPKSVGHHLDDVTEQLSIKATTPSNKYINSPEGFISNFAPKLVEDDAGLEKEDVLGYYDGDDLPFYKYLAENYAYCEKFFCSHPGPTLPNRMFSLTGDVQYDRAVEAIVDNNSTGDSNFYLSRAMTIFDLLTRKGVDWRVYESYPSITMLRMFARYATDNTNIVNIDRLRSDINAENLPAVTFVEPAMHHFPQNDDHSPDADMADGQDFLKGVYDTLRLKDTLWRKTMLIITYDEHGGFYDHVIPPIADLRTQDNAPPPTKGLGPQRRAMGDRVNPLKSALFSSSSLQTGYGLRVPTFVVSPWTMPGKGPDIVLDFCSILKTILARFCGQDKPFISDRVSDSNSFEAYLSRAEPRPNRPDSPPIGPIIVRSQQLGQPRIVTNPISRRQLQSGHVDYHDLTGMLARMLGR